VRDLAAERMEKVNRANARPGEARTVGEFWEGEYKPWAKANLRPSTFDVYASIWGKHLDAELRDERLDS
jgi:hypothetical protein